MTNATFLDELRSARLSHFGSEFLSASLGLGLATLGGVAGIRLLTSVLSPATYGELTLIVTFAALAHQSLLAPLTQAFLRYFAPAHESDRFGSYLWGAWHLLVRAMGIVVVTAFVVGIPLIMVGRNDWVALLWGAVLLSLVFGVGASLDAVQNAARHQSVVAWHQGLTPWLRSLFAFGLVVELGASVGNALLGFVLGSAVVLVSQVWLFRRTILDASASWRVYRRADVESFANQMRSYAWPFATWGVLTWLQMSSDRWALQVFRSTQSVGVYAVLYQLGYGPMTMLSSLIIQIVVPVIYSRSGDGTDKTRVKDALLLTQRLVVGMLIVTGFSSALAFAFRDSIFALLVGPHFRESSEYFPLLVLGGGIFGAGQGAALILMSGTDTRVLIWPKVTTAIVGVFLNLAGAYWFGIPGVVFANVLFGLLYFIWIIIQSQQVVRLVQPYGQYDVHTVGRHTI